MRKLLLTGTALMGSIGLAVAQPAPPPAAPMPMAPTEGFPSTPLPYLGGNNNINQDGGPMGAGPQNPTPGSVVIHLNGRIWGYAGFGGGSGYNYTTAAGTAKLNHFQWIGYMRLYPGVDAMATNGLRYGAIAEIRQNFIGQSYGLSVTPTGTNSNNTGGNYSTSPSGDSCGSTLYFRREAIYLGSNQIGIFRLGQDDGPSSQFDNGVTTFQFGTGAWNGDGPDNIPGNATPNGTFPWWSGIGAEYAVSKGVYFSPRFAGFDFAASYAPNNGANNAAACPVAAAGCDALASNPTTNFGGAGRPANWAEFAARYQGTLGPVGLYATGFYSVSGNVKSTAVGSEQFNGFSVGDFGIVGTVAGFSFGGNVLFGDYNNQVALEPKGGNGKSAIAWLIGAQYTNGPMYVAASYYNYQFTGAWSPGTGAPGTATGPIGNRYDDAFAAGAGYTLAPGLQLYIEYLYGQSHQGGVNLLSGGVGSLANNDVHTQSLIIGSRVQW